MRRIYLGGKTGASRGGGGGGGMRDPAESSDVDSST